MLVDILTLRHIMIYKILTIFVVVFFSAFNSSAQDCVDCHKKTTPNIVSDWKLSKHADIGFTCSDCHGNQHKSVQDVNNVKIPTPETCSNCHTKQVEQFKKGKHANARAAMKAMPTAHWQPMALMEGMKGCGGCHKIGIKTEAEIEGLKNQGAGFGLASCDACHTRHLFSKAEALNRKPVRPATWVSTIPSGKCIHHPNTAFATC